MRIFLNTTEDEENGLNEHSLRVTIAAGLSNMNKLIEDGDNLH